MKISITRTTTPRPKIADESALGFGVHFSDHMFLWDYAQGAGWTDPRIEPYHALTLEPAALVFHYAQEIFEGLKAYRRRDGGIQLFRPRENFRRMNASAARMCMPATDVEESLEALKQLLSLDRDWVPTTRGTSLYVRPTMIATAPTLGVKVSPTYLYFIITGPVAAYYAQGFAPTRIMIAEGYFRAVPGGTGAAKTGGNYAASLLAAEEAHRRGCAQVLWLDARTGRSVEEVGTSNIFFVIRDRLVTPPLGGSILPGVTRDSVLTLARDWGVTVEERAVSVDEIVDAVGSGDLREAFASGTAAVVSPIGEMLWMDRPLVVGDGQAGPLARRLYDELLGIQYGELPDPHGWVEPVA